MKQLLALGILCALSGAGAAADLHAVVHNQKGEPVADAVVVAVPDAPQPKPSRPKIEQVEQIDEEFVPKVKAVLVGSSVLFPNRDSVRHHVYSFSPPKRFDLPLYTGTPANPIVFDAPGVVTLGCNIHDWMIGYIYVSESPYFSTTGIDGKATISMPDGGYAVRVWHPQLAGPEDGTRRKVDLDKSAELHWQLDLKPEVRIRRISPTRQRGGY